MSLIYFRKRRKVGVNLSMVNEKEVGRKSGQIMEFEFYFKYKKKVLEIIKNIVLIFVQ